MVLLPFQSLPLRLFAVAQQDDMPHKQLCSRTRYLLPEAKISQVGLAKSRSCDTVPRQRLGKKLSPAKPHSRIHVKLSNCPPSVNLEPYNLIGAILKPFFLPK